MEGRLFDEREVAQIIERAAERQAMAPVAPRVGLTLDELERLAGEAGIDPRHVRAAAAEVGAGAAGRTAGQTHTHVHVERWIDGPLSVTAWEDSIGALRDRFGMDAGGFAGHASSGLSQVGNTYEWTHTSVLGVQTRVAVSSRGDRTRMRLSQLVGVARPEVEGPLWGSLLALVGGFLPALALFRGEPALIAAITALAFVLFTGAVLVADRAWRARRLRHLEETADMLTLRLLAPAEPPGSERAAGVVESSAIDLEALPEPPAAEAPRRRARERD